MTSSIEKEYIDALNRLIEKKAPISLNKVALEAGKKAGSLRRERYPFVCKEVQRAIEMSRPKTINPKGASKPASNDLKQKYEELKADYESALQKIISLENQLFEVTKELQYINDESQKRVANIKSRL
jgi:chemotaxis regulatin CheY-phosphate phosphatase CheZ